MSKPKLKQNPPLRSLVAHTGIVLTDDDQLRCFANTPEETFASKAANTAMAPTSLKDICERAAKRDCKYITFFHDHFFGGGERELHLTHPEFIDCTKKISEYAAKYGMGIGASVTNPLDLGRTFKKDVGVGGGHRFFAEGILDENGDFCFDGALSERWCNNKGYTYPQFVKARLFVYTEKDAGGQYLVIPPKSIVELEESDFTCAVSGDSWKLEKYFGKRHMRVSGHTDKKGNRVFAVFHMDTPEMDYFHPEVYNYAHKVIDMYRAQGVEFLELYSDEMHIQFDWDFAHFGPYELPTRYMTDNFQAELAKEDDVFADFDKALIYFGYDMLCDRETLGRSSTQHVLGPTTAQLYRTFRLRKTYYEMLQDRVVDICCDARDYIRNTYVKNTGWDPNCLGHATWQESPTCDQYAPGEVSTMFNGATINGYCAYDYTPDYVYSSTIRECISGCYDYFKWNDYFSYGGNDFCECGWFDRNYYGGAMAASLGALNRNEVGSWGSWGFPEECRKRFNCVDIGYGTARSPLNYIMTEGRPRSIDVLYVYPKHLTSVEERFGSWMVQYGYANYCPADRIVELGRIINGRLKLGIAEYSAVVVGFEPYYEPKFLELLLRFAKGGGRVLWNAAPAADKNGKVPQKWLDAFGIASVQSLVEGGKGSKVTFGGALKTVKPQFVPTDFLVDRLYSLQPKEDTEVVAYSGKTPIGVIKPCVKGLLCYIGCRLRDDQSGESGDAPRTLFDVLKAIGAYGGLSSLDNTETVSRNSKYFATKFTCGTYSICNHYYPMKELWEGGFSRDPQRDAKTLENYKYMVNLELDLHDFPLEGHRISYTGQGILQYRLNRYGKLVGFRGRGATGIAVDGKHYSFTDSPAEIIFNEISRERLPDGYTKGWQVYSSAEKVRLYAKIPADAELYAQTDDKGERLESCDKLSLEGDVLTKGDVRWVVILAK